MNAELSEQQIAQAEAHIAYEGDVELRKWIDTSAHGFKITLGLTDRSQLDAFDGVMAMRKSRGGQRYHAILQPYVTNMDHGRQVDGDQVTQQEWQFAGRGWSESSGAHIAVHLGDRTAILWWRTKTAADQVEAEHRGAEYRIMLLELQDDETIVNQEFRKRVVSPDPPKGGPRSKHVARLLQDHEFGRWLDRNSIHSVVATPNCSPATRSFDERDAYVKRACGIKSKVEFDHDDNCWNVWEVQFHRPFIQWMQRSGH